MSDEYLDEDLSGVLTEKEDLQERFNSLREEYEDLFSPKDNRIVSRSPYFSQIIEKILSGSSPERVSIWLNEMFEVKISASSIRDYVRNYIPAKFLVSENYLRVKFAHVETISNDMILLSRLIMVQESRISTELQKEETAHALRRTVRYELDFLRKLYKDMVELKKELGVLRVDDAHATREQALVGSRQDNINTAEDVDSATKVLSALERTL